MRICSFACSCCLLHIENVDKEYVAEAEDPDMEYREEHQPFAESNSVEEQDLEANFANPDLQQGKPRLIWKPNVTTISLSRTIATLLMH